MTIQQIELFLSKHIDSFLNNIFNDYFNKIKLIENISKIDFINEFKKSIFIGGGCIASLLNNTYNNIKFNDIDIFFKNNEKMEFFINYILSNYNLNNDEQFKYSSKFHEFYEEKSIKNEILPDIDDIINKNDFLKYVNTFDIIHTNNKLNIYSPLCITKNAITFNSNFKEFKTIQFIILKTFDVNNLKKQFDFVHTTNYFDCFSNKLYLNDEALQSIINNELIYLNNCIKPISSFFRIKKFQKNGWKISNIEVLKLLYDMTKIRLDSIDNIKYHLSGISSNIIDDVFNNKINDDYDFIQIINILNEHIFLEKIIKNDNKL